MFQFQVLVLLSFILSPITIFASSSDLHHIYYTLGIAFPPASTSLYRQLVSADPELFPLLTSDQKGTLTLFVPTDEAFNAINLSDTRLVSFILRYHLLNQTIYSTQIPNATTTYVNTLAKDSIYVQLPNGKGQAVGVNKDQNGVVTVVGASSSVALVNPRYSNIAASNGVIHSVDHLLLPPSLLSTTLTDPQLQASTFIYASLKANRPLSLLKDLDHISNLTLLIPSNDAFASLGDDLYKITSSQWDHILGYHAIPRWIVSTHLQNGHHLKTVSGIKLNVKITAGSIYINNAKVIRANVLTSSGVVHILDSVIKVDENSME